MGKPRDLANVVATGNILADGAVAPAELTGVTSTAAEINILDGVTATAAELNLLDGVTATTAELNYVDGVTSNVQTQMDTKAPVASPTFTGTATAPTVNASTALQIGGTAITATATELNKMDGVTVSASDINSVTSKAPTSGPTFTGTVTIGGTTYPTSDGSAGQVLTTNGSGAVSFSDPAGGGGQFDAVASGNISNGDLVVLNSNGTVSTHQGFLSDATALGSGIDTRKVSATFDSSNNKVVVCYNDSDTDKGMAAVGTVSNNAITFGTPVEFNSEAIQYVAAVFDTNANKVVVGYQTNTGQHLKAAVGTVSGTSISFGTPVTLLGQQAVFIAGCFDSNVNKCAFFFRNQSDQGAGIVATVSGTSLTSGSQVLMTNSGSNMNINNIGANFDSNNNKCLVAFTNASDSSKGYSIVATPSSAGGGSETLTFGEPVKFYDSAVVECEVGFDSNVNKSLITWRDANVDNKIRAAVTSISSTTPSYGTTVIVDNTAAAGGDNNRRIAFDSNLNKLVLVFVRAGSDNDKFVTLGTISGTDVTFATPIRFDTTATTELCVAFDSNADQSVIFYMTNESGGNIGTGKVVFGDYGESFFNWAGIAQSAISNGATGTVTVLGGISENQSSLTIGSAHYLKDDGTFTTTATSGREIGKALSATKLLITQGSVT